MQQEDGNPLAFMTRGYNNISADPCFLLGKTQGRLIILFGVQKCSQSGTSWENSIIAMAGDPHPGSNLPSFWVSTPGTSISSLVRKITLTHMASASQMKAMAKNDQNPHVPPSVPSKKATPKTYSTCTLVKLPPAILAKALVAADPQSQALTFLLDIIASFKSWEKVIPNIKNPKIKLMDQYNIIMNSLKGFATAHQTAGER
jgi:hypothetical protein